MKVYTNMNIFEWKIIVIWLLLCINMEHMQ